MTYVVTEPCHDCKYTDCVTVCPTDAFYQDDWMLYIHPDDCIHCEACMPECPVEAIFPDVDVPSRWIQYVELNRDRTATLIAQSQGRSPSSRSPSSGLSASRPGERGRGAPIDRFALPWHPRFGEIQVSAKR